MRQIDYDAAMHAKALISDGYALVATAGEDKLIYFRHADRDIQIVVLKQLESEIGQAAKYDIIHKLSNEVYYEDSHLVDEVHKLVNVVKVMTKEQAKEIFIDTKKQVQEQDDEREL